MTPDEVRAAIEADCTEDRIAEAFPHGLDFITHSLFLMSVVPPVGALHESLPLLPPVTEEEHTAVLAEIEAVIAQSGVTQQQLPALPRPATFLTQLRQASFPVKVEDGPNVEGDQPDNVQGVCRALAFMFAFFSQTDHPSVSAAIFVSPQSVAFDASASNLHAITISTSIPVPLNEGFLPTLRDPSVQHGWEPVTGGLVAFYHDAPVDAESE